VDYESELYFTISKIKHDGTSVGNDRYGDVSLLSENEYTFIHLLNGVLPPVNKGIIHIEGYCTHKNALTNNFKYYAELEAALKSYENDKLPVDDAKKLDVIKSTFIELSLKGYELELGNKQTNTIK